MYWLKPPALVPNESYKDLGEGACENGLLLLLMEGADTDGRGGQHRPADQPELRRTEEWVQSG